MKMQSMILGPILVFVGLGIATLAKHPLICGLDSKEYKRISSCDSAKEIWDKLEVTYEGTN